MCISQSDNPEKVIKTFLQRLYILSLYAYVHTSNEKKYVWKQMKERERNYRISSINF